MAALLFIAVWIVVGLGLVFVGMRGGPRGARESLHGQGRRTRRVATGLFVVAYIGLGVAIPTVVIASNQDQHTASTAHIFLTASQRQGRELFARTCGTCHTLKGAATTGRVGPNLDQLRPPSALVLNAIEQGRARGAGQMPAALYDGTDARDVASFVAKVAGR